ncbi:hypothetical protein ACFE04_029231 [Oxalis oulophora]
MTIEFENSKNPIKSWGSKHEEEVAMKMQQKKSTTMDHNKQNTMSSKRTCICAPTSHEGSFRCHLHRKIATPKPSLTSPKFGSGPNQAHQLSRFSKVACTD